MIGLLVVGHGDFAQTLVQSANAIMGEQELLGAIGLLAEEGFADWKERLLTKLQEMVVAAGGDGVLVLVDLFGGTPGHGVLSIKSQLDTDRICAITGANLGMLLEGIQMREYLPLLELKTHCLTAGTGGIRDMMENGIES
ncbi:PTS mannose transporter subunit IIAB [Eubacteriales bacterium OttesenSCG-928-M02]|nr:PTS mannose transporter subunit IIAB [Eubacteriales bacterium OttesenSCG-928-M02]